MILDMILSFFYVLRIFDDFWTVVRTVCGQCCGIFGGFFAVVGPILH